ncbi:carbon-nitrogen hydrolase family protein [Pseudopelagicola sp. nBUS_19]|uniref:carbon-nitrogen hydrolase family protein n=1 Tax=Pseudopelagicola sp. nBUS_19 TaxID=3395316 RepID=UPI003EBEDBBA
MPRIIDIACLQTRPMPDFASALDEALPMAEAAVQAGADILFLPEYCGGLKSNGQTLEPPSEPETSHPFLIAMLKFAADKNVWINVGSIAVRGPSGRLINRGLMLDDRGEIRGRYDKIHLFDVRISDNEVYRESATVEPGNEAVIHQTPYANVGHTICYDLRFPGLFRNLAHGGAEIICCPAAFTKHTGEAHWHILNRARAIENTCFVVSCCAIGPIAGGGESYGHSLVVNPWGEIVADGGALPGIVHARIDLDLVPTTGARIPSLSHDQPYKGFRASSRSVT